MTLREDLEAKVAKMTPGRWDHTVDGPMGVDFICCPPTADHPDCWIIGDDAPARFDDAAGIVALRNAAPALLAALRVVEAVKGARRRYGDFMDKDIDAALDEYDRLAAEVAG